MPAILACHSSQRHIDCQKRNGVSGPVANRIERAALILILPPAVAMGASSEHQGGAFVLPGWLARSAKRPKLLPGTSCKRSTSTRTAVADALSGIEGVTASVVMYAVNRGWVELRGNHSICVTEVGRRLVLSHAH